MEWKQNKNQKISKHLKFNTHQLAYLGEKFCPWGNQVQVKIPKWSWNRKGISSLGTVVQASISGRFEQFKQQKGLAFKVSYNNTMRIYKY